MFQSRRKALSQNFLHNRILLEKLVRTSSIGHNDHVFDIGAGKGIVTEILSAHASRVTAIELDERLIPRLERLQKSHDTLTVMHADFLRYTLPQNPYKVFANIPFSIESQIIRKLLQAPNPPKDTYLIVRKDLAERFVAHRRATKLSVMYAPWFMFSIIHQFKGSDFTPHARMSTVLLRIDKRIQPALDEHKKVAFQRFIESGFKDGRPLRRSLTSYFPRGRLDTVASKLQFSPTWTPSKLSVTQWINMFQLLERE